MVWEVAAKSVAIGRAAESVMNARYLGIDYGTKRIGLAVSDAAGGIASPLQTLPVVGTCDRQVRDVIEAAADFDVDEWLVGLPLNMDGSSGPQAALAREFATLLAEATGAPVHLWDERLSSYAADAHLSQSGLTHLQKKRRRDAIAAQVILQSFLDARAESG